MPQVTLPQYEGQRDGGPSDTEKMSLWWDHRVAVLILLFATCTLTRETARRMIQNQQLEVDQGGELSSIYFRF